MLNREQIIGMTKIKGNSNYFVSCYLDVDPVVNVRGDYLIHIKNMLRDAAENQEKEVRKKVRPDMEKIDAYIFSRKRSFRKGLALFSSAEADFWQEVNLSVNLKNEIYVEKTPFMKPLMDVMDRYPRYAVMLLGKESARLFVVHMGEVEEYRKIATDNVPGRHKKGGWFSLEQKSYERHTDYHVGLHLKDVIKQLESLVAAGDITRIVTGGPEEVVSRARTLFAKPLAEKVIGFFAETMSARINDILSKAQAVIDAHEEKDKADAVGQLLTMTMKKEPAVLGIDDVLSSLREGRVMRMLYLRDYKTSGFACTSCGFITVQQISACPYCKETVRKTDHLVDLAAQKAVEQGAAVEVVAASKDLARSGNIGAFLRY